MRNEWDTSLLLDLSYLYPSPPHYPTFPRSVWKEKKWGKVIKKCLHHHHRSYFAGCSPAYSAVFFSIDLKLNHGTHIRQKIDSRSGLSFCLPVQRLHPSMMNESGLTLDARGPIASPINLPASSGFIEQEMAILGRVFLRTPTMTKLPASTRIQTTARVKDQIKRTWINDFDKPIA